MNILFGICDNSHFLYLFLIIKYLIRIICTITPIVIIYKLIKVLSKEVIEGNGLQKQIGLIVKTIIAGLVVFMIPTIIHYSIEALANYNLNELKTCYDSASLNGIKKLKEKEEEERKRQLEEKQKEQEKAFEKAAKEREKQNQENSDKMPQKKNRDSSGNPNNTKWVNELLNNAKTITDYTRENKFIWSDAPYNPAMNHDAKTVSCDRCVGWFLYETGYTDQPYEHGLVVSSFPAWFEKHGFVRINSASELQAGDIVFVNPDANGNPEHVYLLGNPLGDGIWERYDCGSTDRIQLINQYSGYTSQPFHEGIGSFLYAYRAPEAIKS